MLKPFFWMFGTKGFIKHFFCLCGIVLLFSLLILSTSIYSKNIPLPPEYILLFILVCTIIPTLVLTGYFWNLTDNIIIRTIDISASNVYSGKIKKRIVIELPKLNILKLIWRGIASFVATIMLIIPIAWMVYLSLTSERILNDAVYYCIAVFFCMFIPALLWNYARENSVFAVWNVQKAIHVIGYYPFRYLWKTIVFVLVSVVMSIAHSFLTSLFHLNNFSIQNGIAENIGINFSIYFLISCFVSIYQIFVQAYLLGTIAPVDEI